MITEKLGPYLKRARKELTLTLRVVEEKTGVSNAYLSQLENGKVKNPSPAVLHKLSKVYKISYGRLMKLAGHPLPELDNQKLKPSFRLGNKFEDLTEEEEEKLTEYLKFLRSRKR